MPAPLVLKQGEAKTLTITVKENEAPVDLTGATLFLGVKKLKSDAGYTFSKDDVDFNKGQAAQGVVSVFIDEDDSNQPQDIYILELSVSLPGEPVAISKSSDLFLIIQDAVIKP